MIKNNYSSSYIYLFSLFLGWLFLYYILYIVKIYDIKIKKNEINPKIINYIYIIFFGCISGLLVLLGYKYCNKLIQYFIINDNLTYLTTTSIMITIGFSYSAYIKEIFEELYNQEFIIDEWSNILGYSIGRFIFIMIIFLFFIKK